MTLRRLAATIVVVALGLVAAPAAASTPAKPPKACLRALARAEHLMDLAVEGFGYASEAFDAASNFDVDALEEAGQAMSDLAPEVSAARSAFDAAAASCRRS